MKKPFYFLFGLVLLISVACSLPINQNEESESNIELPTTTIQPVIEETTSVPTKTVYSPPTARPTDDSTATPVPTKPPEIPTNTSTEPIAACPAFTREEFDSPGECWPDSVDEIFSSSSISNKRKVNVQIKDGRMEFETQLSEDIFIYSFYKENEYEEVITRASVSKIEPSANQNGFSLACHVNSDGWYEVRIDSSGIFEIYQYNQINKQSGKNPYLILGNGGVSNFKTSAGRENIIEWQCGYDYLRFLVNEKQVWQKTGMTNLNSGGGVGIGMASYSGVFPRHIAYDWIELIEP